MAKKVLIISTSLRGGSNSDILANECAKGAKEAGHDVELLSLKGKDIKYCIGCLSCQRTGRCVLKDDVADIMVKVKDAEVIVYATPIYYYEMCGQMKTLLDRLIERKDNGMIKVITGIRRCGKSFLLFTIERYYQSLLKRRAVINPLNKTSRNEFVSSSTVRDVNKLLRNCFEQAVKWELMEKNPCTHATVRWYVKGWREARGYY